MSIFSDFSHKPKKHKLLIFLCAGLAAFFVALLAVYLFESGKSLATVMKDGQRVRITIATGAIEGGLKPEEKTSEKNNEKTSTEPAKENETTKAELIPKEPTEKPVETKAPVQEGTKDITKKPKPPAVDDPFAAFVGEEDSAIQTEPLEENAQPSADKELPASASGSDIATGSDTIPAYPRSAISLDAVIPALQEKVAEGMLPRISKDGLRPADAYARPFIADEETPTITLLISNLGLNKRATELALDLPVDVSLSFDPYAEFTPTWAEGARNLGHEVWLDAPLQASDYPASDPGELGLTVDATDEVNLQRIKELLTSYQGYVGLTAAPDEAFSTNRKAMTILISVLKQRGVTLLFGNRDASIVSSPIVTTNGKTVTVADVIIDKNLNTEMIRRQLATLETIARDKGIATGMARAYPLSMREISSWINSLRGKGIILAPMSAATQLK